MILIKPIKLPKVSNVGNFDGLDPLDGRYYDAQIAGYLSERSRLAHQAYIEAALAHTLADYGICSRQAALAIEKAAAKVTVEDVQLEEKVTKHDIKALVNVIKKHAGPKAAPYVHFGATSYDIVSTASALQMQSATRLYRAPGLNFGQKPSNGR